MRYYSFAECTNYLAEPAIETKTNKIKDPAYNTDVASKYEHNFCYNIGLFPRTKYFQQRSEIFYNYISEFRGILWCYTCKSFWDVHLKSYFILIYFYSREYSEQQVKY